ncbi:N-alpha-acetyltransferase 80 isoform X2 [Venturia canescens]|uniref:N-alpha-acetyltransferase 80 isoform X2 n=1 Tax=Venturia canescens TaxID=32260 RepID=UPI001C9C7C7E|nr:N-alpha-acetyltransferase 80 isoform X2 [Venturia canescens]
MEIMKDSSSSSYSIIPIHERPDLSEECCRIINAEWPASETRRLRTLRESCDEFPTCLVLLKGEKVIGHCKLSLVPSEFHSCFLGSVVIDHAWRSQGLGSLLLRGAEEYAAKKRIEKIYLTTQGQEGFYEKNGYVVCPPVNIWNYIILPTASTTPIARNENSGKKEFFGPPPPPMPVAKTPMASATTSNKTYMVKHL